MAFCGSEGSLLFFIILRIAFSTSGESCEKVDVCTCKFSNGSTVSLKKADGGSKPSFTGIAGQASRTFDWNPCTPFTESAASDCKDIMVCQVAGATGYPAGSKDTSFSVDSSGNVVISYGKITDTTSHTRETKITLKCDPKGTGKGTVDKAGFSETNPSSTSSIYTGTLTSRYACAVEGSSSPSSSSSGGLSVGSILLIIFFPLVLMYVIIGVLVNRYGRGIENMPELLPNHSFWADFPFLVKDGIVFTGGCIKAGCSSLSNKFKKDGYAEI